MDVKSVSQDQAKPDDEPKPQEPLPTHRGVGTWSLWLSMAPFIYVLSTGPVCKLVDLGIIRQSSAFDRFYYPLALLVRNSPPAQKLFRWYIEDVWKSKTH